MQAAMFGINEHKGTEAVGVIGMSRNVGLPSFHPSESLRSYLMAARSAGIELV